MTSISIKNSGFSWIYRWSVFARWACRERRLRCWRPNRIVERTKTYRWQRWQTTPNKCNYKRQVTEPQEVNVDSRHFLRIDIPTDEYNFTINAKTHLERGSAWGLNSDIIHVWIFIPTWSLPVSPIEICPDLYIFKLYPRISIRGSGRPSDRSSVDREIRPSVAPSAGPWRFRKKKRNRNFFKENET